MKGTIAYLCPKWINFDVMDLSKSQSIKEVMFLLMLSVLCICLSVHILSNWHPSAYRKRIKRM